MDMVYDVTSYLVNNQLRVCPRMKARHDARVKSTDERDSERAEAIGRRIAELRKARGLNQTRLGRSVGISQAAIGKIETGINAQRFVEVEKLARALGVTPNLLLGVEDPAMTPELLGAALEPMLELLGADREAAQEIARIALEVLHIAQGDDGAQPASETVRAVARALSARANA